MKSLYKSLDNSAHKAGQEHVDAVYRHIDEARLKEREDADLTKQRYARDEQF